MTTSVRQPTLADSGIGQLVVFAAKTLKQVPPDDAPIEHCGCAYTCDHILVWVPVMLVVGGRPTGLMYWTCVCIAGCEPGPNQH